MWGGGLKPAPRRRWLAGFGYPPDNARGAPNQARTADQPADVEVQVWNAIRADNKAVGFDYIGVGGRERRIAYAKELQRAVVVAQ